MTVIRVAQVERLRLADAFGWRASLRFKGRLLLSTAAIALGVALGYAIHLINAAAVDEFARGLRTASGSADLAIRGPASGIPVDVYTIAARAVELAVASPIVEIVVRVEDAGEYRAPIPVLGVDAMRAARIAPALVGEAAEPMDALRDDTIFLSVTLAAALGKQVGDNVTVHSGTARQKLRVAGLLGAQAPIGDLAVMDIAAAQMLAEMPDRVSRIDLRLHSGVDIEQTLLRLRSLLPAGVSVERVEDALAANARLSRAYRVNLTVLALVALFTGSLLVFSSEALTTARRRGELAILRVLGMTRRMLLFRLLRGAAAIGLIGSALGLAFGGLIAYAVTHWVGADLGAGYFRGARPSLVLQPLPALAFLLCGVISVLSGALLPAIEASRVEPAVALKSINEALHYTAFARPHGALAILLVGCLLAWAPPIDGLPIGGYAAIACFLLSAIALLPFTCRVALGALPPFGGVVGWLAFSRLGRAPVEAAISLAAMVAAVSLTVSMAIMVSSFRLSMIDWLDQLLPADLYVRGSVGGQPSTLTPEDQRTIAGTPGIRRVEFLRTDAISLDSRRPRVSVLARDLDAATIGERVPLLASMKPAPGDVPVWISEVTAGAYGIALGDPMSIPLGAHVLEARVAGIWRDYGRPQGAIVIERARYAALTGDARANDASIWYEGASAAESVANALEWLRDRAHLTSPGDIKSTSLRIFDRTFAVTYGLEAIAMVIGMAGLSAGIGAGVAARRREFGVLRHLGFTRSQIAAMLAAEGAIMSLVGVVVGSATGWFVSLILIHVVNRQSFHWGMDLHVPFGVIGSFCASLIVVAALVAIASGRQAMQGETIDAVRNDW